MNMIFSVVFTVVIWIVNVFIIKRNIETSRRIARLQQMMDEWDEWDRRQGK